MVQARVVFPNPRSFQLSVQLYPHPAKESPGSDIIIEHCPNGRFPVLPGTPVHIFCRAVRHATGVLGVLVKIMLPQDPTGKLGPAAPQPDQVTVLNPKDDTV